MEDTLIPTQLRSSYVELLFHDWMCQKWTSHGNVRNHSDQRLQMVMCHIETEIAMLWLVN